MKALILVDLQNDFVEGGALAVKGGKEIIPLANKPIILEIAASEMQQGGYAFYLSANGVWLVDSVPPQFISRKN